VAHTALLEGAARPEQVTRTALLVFSPPAAQAKTLSTPRVRALARAPVRPPEQIIQSRVPIGTPCRRLPIGRLGLPSVAARLRTRHARGIGGSLTGNNPIHALAVPLL